MDTADADLIRQSYVSLTTSDTDVADLFFSHLFDAKPELVQLFKSPTNVANERFATMLKKVVDYAINPEGFEDVARSLALRHITYGVNPSHFEAVGKALQDTLEMGLEQGFGDQTAAAWQKAFDYLSTSMITAMANEVTS